MDSSTLYNRARIDRSFSSCTYFSILACLSILHGQGFGRRLEFFYEFHHSTEDNDFNTVDEHWAFYKAILEFAVLGTMFKGSEFQVEAHYSMVLLEGLVFLKLFSSLVIVNDLTHFNKCLSNMK